MKHAFDTATAAIASGLSRRHVLKVVAATFVAAVPVKRAWAGQSAASLGQAAAAGTLDPKLRAVRLKLFRPDGVSKLVISGAIPARVTIPGQKITAALVPHFIDGVGAVELSIYDSSTMTLARRLPLALKAKAVPADVSFLPGVSFASAGIISLLREPVGDDCCVMCCQGIRICASGVCCSESDPNCGHCCDYGSCQPDCDCCKPWIEG